MSNGSLKLLALVCKIFAIFVSVVVPMILHPRWGVNPVADVQLVGLAVLSLIPNRWLVFSSVSFFVSLLLALFPFHAFFPVSVFRGVDFGLLVSGLMISFLLFAPLPLSLIFSWMRFRKGEKFTYA
jgi:hypothetical protein